MNVVDDNALWQQARLIFETFLELPHEEALQQLDAMSDVSMQVKERVQRLLKATLKSKTILQEADSGQIYNHLKTLTNMSGRNIGPYRLEALIAVGGMSSIYRGQRVQAGVQKPVAIKIMSAHNRSARIITLFNREQEALSKLNHPNIVSFLHGGQNTEGTYYLVMELIEDAVTLDQYVSQNQCSVKTIVKLIHQAAEAMAYAHNNLVIHRDLKATNLLIDQHGYVKIVDFGIAAFAENHDQPTTQVYTPEIASPEQIRGTNITTKTDIFSLAATLLGLLTDGHALPDFDPDYYDEANDELFISKKLASSDLDRDLCNVLSKALNTNPDKRYTTMDAFARDLHHWLTQEPVSATSDSNLYRLRKAMRRNPLLSSALLLFIVFLLAALLVVRNYAQNAENQAQQAQKSLSFLTEVLSQADPSEGNPGNMTIRDALKSTLQQQQEVLADDPELQIAVLTRVSDIYNALGLFKEAAQSSETLYATLVQLYGESDDRSLQRQTELGSLYHAAGNYAVAIETGEQMLQTLQGLPESDPHYRLKVLNTLIKSHEQLSNREAALNYQDDATQLIESGLLSDDSLIGRTYNSLAVLANRRGQREVATVYYQKSLLHTEKAYTKTSPIYAGILNGYAIHVGRGGDYAASGTLFAESIELMRSFDPESFVLGRNMVQYAHLLYLQERIPKALETLQEAVDILEKTDHYYSRMLGQEKKHLFYSRLYELDTALDGALKSIAYAQKVLGENNKRTIGNVIKLINLLGVLGEVELAVQYQQQVIGFYRSHEDAANISRTYAIAGIFHVLADEIEAAESFYQLSQEATDASAIAELHILTLLLHPQQADLASEFTDKTLPGKTVHILRAGPDADHAIQLCVLDQGVRHSADVLLKKVFLLRCLELALPVEMRSAITKELNALEAGVEQTLLTFEQRFAGKL
ncbi:protein kinase [Marinicella sp. W31]|uniref:protein kinase domain-containing protein n=1 Tax=Marinicella sp. W31 TaxID=3023713 RepID=UPI003756C588